MFAAEKIEPNQSPVPVLRQLVGEATQELFMHYELDLSTVGPSESERMISDLAIVAVIGFTGDSMRGSAILATVRPILETTDPTGEASARDWMSELANQLLGRVKNKLLSRDCIIRLGTPVALAGLKLELTPTNETTVAQAFISADGQVCVWFDAELTDDFVLGEPTGEDIPGEGDSLMF